ncbi:histone acetyltransferase p300-like isoform X2, partial [Clarias magur]
MEKLTMNSGGGGEVERDMDTQGDAGEPLRENGKAGAGQSPTVSRAQNSSPRMLVALDILCLIV